MDNYLLVFRKRSKVTKPQIEISCFCDVTDKKKGVKRLRKERRERLERLV